MQQGVRSHIEAEIKDAVLLAREQGAEEEIIAIAEAHR